MRQVLFTIPSSAFKVFGYGVMLFLAFLGSMNLAAWRARREKLDPEVIYDLALWVFLGGLVGARVFYVVQYWGDTVHTSGTSSRSGRGGSSSTAASWAGRPRSSSTGRAPFPLRPMLDVVAPSLALGIAMGRLGCFLNGCCYGDRATCPGPSPSRRPRLPGLSSRRGLIGPERRGRCRSTRPSSTRRSTA